MTLAKELAKEAMLHLFTIAFFVVVFAGVTHRMGRTCDAHGNGAQAATRK